MAADTAPKKIEPERILKDLRELWAKLGSETEVSGGVLRACGMTLLVAAENDSDAEDVRRTLGVLMHDHPARAIVLRLRDAAAGETSLDAKVFAECWMPFGRHQQICADGIEITAGATEMRHVAQLLLPLIVSDLPTVLWSRGTGAFAPGAFEPVLPLVQKIVVDSAKVPDAQKAIETLRDLRKGGRLVADLNWTRLTGWREELASLFDDGTLKLDTMKSVRIAHGGEAVSTCALYFSNWVRKALPDAQVSVEKIEGEMGLRSIAFTFDHSELTIARVDGQLEVRSGEHTRKSPLPETSDEALMREELSILGTDTVFDGVLA